MRYGQSIAKGQIGGEWSREGEDNVVQMTVAKRLQRLCEPINPRLHSLATYMYAKMLEDPFIDCAHLVTCGVIVIKTELDLGLDMCLSIHVT